MAYGPHTVADGLTIHHLYILGPYPGAPELPLQQPSPPPASDGGSGSKTIDSMNMPLAFFAWGCWQSKNNACNALLQYGTSGLKIEAASQDARAVCIEGVVGEGGDVVVWVDDTDGWRNAI